MIRRAWALCVLFALVATGGAQAHDSGPEIARALVALRQGPLSVDPATDVSPQQAEAVDRRLRDVTGILVAVLPVDYSLSAVGAARELELHLNRPGTVIAVLGGDLGRQVPKSTGVCWVRSSTRASRCTTEREP